MQDGGLIEPAANLSLISVSQAKGALQPARINNSLVYAAPVSAPALSLWRRCGTTAALPSGHLAARLPLGACAGEVRFFSPANRATPVWRVCCKSVASFRKARSQVEFKLTRVESLAAR